MGTRTTVGVALAGLTLAAVTGCGSPAGPPTAGTGPNTPSPADAGGSSAAEAAGTAASAQAAAGPGTSSSPAQANPPAAQRRYVFPVDGKSSYAREHHDYPASDIIAACGLPVRAITDATVLEVSRTDTFDKNTSGGADRGGLSVSMLGDDGVRYYGSHFSAIEASVQPGVRVAAGTKLGQVGRTGNANNTCHLHLGISPVCARTADWWIRRGVVWPWSYLDAWRAGQQKSPAAEIQGWQARNGCPQEPKS